MDFGGNASAGLDKAWLLQLHREFEQICYQYSLDLVHPVIELIDSGHRYGYWQRSSRTIGINRQVILGHGWDATIHVLKHEIAHQLCDEVFECRGTAHDEDFHRACEMLGLPEKFAKAHIDPHCFALTAAPGENRDDSRSKLIEKVRKVMALSNSANENEARLALEMAARLLQRHDLAESELERQPDDMTYVIISLARRRVCFYQRLIASLLSRYFNVRMVSSRLYDPAADQTYRTFEVFGRLGSVAVVEHCFHFLENRLAVLWQEHCRNHPGPRRKEKGSYYCGVLHGFEESLKAVRGAAVTSKPGTSARQRQQEPQLLPAPADPLADAFIGRRHPRLRTVSSRKTRVDQETFSRGMAAGREIRLRDAVSNENGGAAAPKMIGTTLND